MKKAVLILIALTALSFAACKQKTETPESKAPAPAMPAQPGQPGMPPQAMPQGGDPHAGMVAKEIPAGTGRKGKVLSVLNAAGYTYVEIDEKGKKVWVAVPEMKVKTGDMVEFPDNQPMVNFKSKTLNRTFESIIFAPGLNINK